MTATTKTAPDATRPAKINPVNYFINADFSWTSQRTELSEYIKQIGADEFTNERVQISVEVELAPEQWNLWASNLLDTKVWLSGKGGYKSTFEIDKEYFAMTPKELIQWKKGQYRANCVLVKCGWVKAVVDPQGLDHAYCVGLNVQPA